MSRILVITEFYYPDPAVGQRMQELLSSLVGQGNDITVYASRSRYMQEGSGRTEDASGVRVVRLGSVFPASHRIVAKAAAAWGFLLHALLRAACARRFDILITFSTPPMGHVLANWVAHLRKAKSVFWCADLHPESAIRLGLLRESSLATRILRWLNRSSLAQCDAIVAVGRCMKQLLQACGAPASRVFVVPMWHREELAGVVQSRDTEQLRASLGIPPGTFVVMYSGNLGRVHVVSDIFEAAAGLAGSNIVFLVAAGGCGMRELEALQQRHALPNLVTRPLFPEDQIRTALAMADVHLLSLRSELCGVSVPGKLYGIMAVGRPAVFIGPAGSEAAIAIREGGCGFQVPPGDIAQLSRVLTRLSGDSPLREELGNAARQSFSRHFSASVCSRQWQQVLARGLAEQQQSL